MSTSHIEQRARLGPAAADAVALQPERTSILGLHSFAAHDLIALAYLAVLRAWIAVSPRDDGGAAARMVGSSLLLAIFGVAVARVVPGVPVAIRAVVYRLSVIGVVLLNYATLPKLFPVLAPFSVDASLLRADQLLFGGTPAIWLERVSSPAVVEYFSAVYFSYYFVLAYFVVGTVFFFAQGRATAEFAIGTVFIFSVAQVGYLLVPAYGPVAYLKSTFHAPLQGGTFWRIVWNAYLAGSSGKDVFPSMHTGGTTWVTLYAISRAVGDPSWRRRAGVMVFVVANIIVSTMLLRWHYAVDVVAGLALAGFTLWLAKRLARAEEAWRAARGFAPVFPELPWGRASEAPRSKRA